MQRPEGPTQSSERRDLEHSDASDRCERRAGVS